MYVQGNKNTENPQYRLGRCEQSPPLQVCKWSVETNDEALVSKLEALGHTAEGEADAKPLDKMKVDELKA